MSITFQRAIWVLGLHLAFMPIDVFSEAAGGGLAQENATLRDDVASLKAGAALADNAIYLIMAIAVIVTVVAIRQVFATLVPETWSLNDALSEEATLHVLDEDGLPKERDGKPIEVKRLVASSSRLIAFVGLIGIITLFMAQGLVLLWQAAKGFPIEKPAEAYSTYLFYGAVMFAPYIINKFSNVFAIHAPGKTRS